MKITADESVNYLFVSGLRQRGHEILSIAENYPSPEDEDILAISLNPPAIVITEDKDFGELVLSTKRGLQRLFYYSMMHLKQKHSKELINSFVTVTFTRTRIRYL